jgi:hypothetical protein
MDTKKAVRTIALVWVAWALLVVGFQHLASDRLSLAAPDNVLSWTADETAPGAHDNQPYLLEPFMNHQVAYDSEFYLSIAVAGYDDPLVRAVWLDPAKEPELIWGQQPLPYGTPADYAAGRPPGIPADYVAYSLNYAFFPFYPVVMKAVSFPLQVFGLNGIATATLAGVIVSLLGALGAMLALYDLTRDQLQDRGAIRAAFYLIAFPTGFFLAMVHTEGLFAGLAFGSLAMLRRKRWAWAGLLAGLATVTRAVGAALIIPLGIAWLGELVAYVRLLLRRRTGEGAEARFPWDLLWKGAVMLCPLIAYGLWNLFLGEQFTAVEAAFFNRGALAIQRSASEWLRIYRELFGSADQDLASRLEWIVYVLAGLAVTRALAGGWLQRRIPKVVLVTADLLLAVAGAAVVYIWMDRAVLPTRSFYYLVEFSATIMALIACAYVLRSQPGVALFSLAVVAISFFSGVPQGMHRYILGAPAVFLMLGHLGNKSEAFDRAWTVASVLLMGLFALLFAFNFWVG